MYNTGPDKSRTYCSYCPGDTFYQQPKENQPGGCAICPAGTFLMQVDAPSVSSPTGNRICYSCTGGRYSPDGVVGLASYDDCYLCPLGKSSPVFEYYQRILLISSTSPQTTCHSCPQGTYAALDTIDWTFRAGDSTIPACKVCPAGSYTNQAESTSCHLCPFGKTSQAFASACVDCAPGNFSNEAIDTLSSFVTSQCYACQPGTYSPNPGSTLCLECQPGSYSSQTSTSACVLCPVGTFSQDVGANSSSTCRPCNQGKVSARGSIACTDCPEGSFAANGQCLLCPHGKYTDVQGSTYCFTCDAGTISYSLPETGPTTCTNCPTGLFNSIPGREYCDACDSGKFSPTSGMSTCLQCSPGTFSLLQYENPYIKACTECKPGFFAPTVASTTCSECAPNTYSSQAASVACLNCTTCLLGFTYQETDCNTTYDRVCEECTVCSPIEFYTSKCTLLNNSRCATCKPCPAGQYIRKGTCQDQADTQCELCPPGTFAKEDLTWRRFCIPCPAGSYSSMAGAVQCVRAEPGFHVPIAGMDTEVPCPAGSYSEMPGSLECSLCEMGTASSIEAATNRSACQPCQETTYADQAGSAACSNCSECSGWLSSQASNFTVALCNATADTHCEPCTVCDQNGTQFFIDFCTQQSDSVCQDCSMCPEGSYVEEFCEDVYDTDCHPCLWGSYMPEAGFNSSCFLCSPGKYANFEGQSQCDAAFPGTFVGQPGMYYAELCDPGTYADEYGSIMCKPCEPGYFTGSYASESCEACRQDSYSSIYSALSCTQCPVGKSSWQIAAVSEDVCTPCLICTGNQYAGYSCNHTHETLCIPCTVCTHGKYVLSPCTPESDRNCSYCSTCQDGSFRSSGCAATQVCTPWLQKFVCACVCVCVCVCVCYVVFLTSQTCCFSFHLISPTNSETCTLHLLKASARAGFSLFILWKRYSRDQWNLRLVLAWLSCPAAGKYFLLKLPARNFFQSYGLKPLPRMPCWQLHKGKWGHNMPVLSTWLCITCTR
jgi:hypothetical protein